MDLFVVPTIGFKLNVKRDNAHGWGSVLDRPNVPALGSKLRMLPNAATSTSTRPHGL
jgi:hypothetical protein